MMKRIVYTRPLGTIQHLLAQKLHSRRNLNHVCLSGVQHQPKPLDPSPRLPKGQTTEPTIEVVAATDPELSMCTWHQDQTAHYTPAWFRVPRVSSSLPHLGQKFHMGRFGGEFLREGDLAAVTFSCLGARIEVHHRHVKGEDSAPLWHGKRIINGKKKKKTPLWHNYSNLTWNLVTFGTRLPPRQE